MRDVDLRTNSYPFLRSGHLYGLHFYHPHAECTDVHLLDPLVLQLVNSRPIVNT